MAGLFTMTRALGNEEDAGRFAAGQRAVWRSGLVPRPGYTVLNLHRLSWTKPPHRCFMRCHWYWYSQSGKRRPRPIRTFHTLLEMTTARRVGARGLQAGSGRPGRPGSPTRRSVV